ncbi:radical SAM protein [Candidatus Gracilibacteria bacterium]|nr:radical SAM protein [Candidatus Gracilibacteria bacterium]
MLEDIGHELKKSKIRLFAFSSNDPSCILFQDLPSCYFISLCCQRLGFSRKNFAITYFYAFENYAEYLKKKIISFEEDYFLFFLENYYHSSDYALGFLEEILQFLSKQGIDKKIIVHSLKTQTEDIDRLMKQYPNIFLVIANDLEYVFQEICGHSKPLSEIENIVYRGQNQEAIFSKQQSLSHDLGDSIIGAYWTQDYQHYPKSIAEIREIISALPEKKKQRFLSKISQQKDNAIMLTSGRGCQFNCNYCYRGQKYKILRTIPLETIQKDLDYIQKMGYSYVYFYDDCFISTNKNRLPEIMSLFQGYQLQFNIALRYEVLTNDIMEMFSNSNVVRLQIGLQSSSLKTNAIMLRSFHAEKFRNIISNLSSKGIDVSLDLILGLPGESLAEFLESFHYALSLGVRSIFINKLFLNPKTQLYETKQKHGIQTKGNLGDDLFHVPQVYESSTFSLQDFQIAQKYIYAMKKKFPNTIITLR